MPLEGEKESSLSPLARHDKINPVLWKFKPTKDMVNKTPFHPIEGFFEIDFKSHEVTLALGGDRKSVV